MNIKYNQLSIVKLNPISYRVNGGRAPSPHPYIPHFVPDNLPNDAICEGMLKQSHLSPLVEMLANAGFSIVNYQVKSLLFRLVAQRILLVVDLVPVSVNLEAFLADLK